MIPVCEPELGEQELENVIDAVQSGFVSGTIGEFLTEFEEGFADYCGVEHGIATTSGTTALHLAVETLDLDRDAEVLVPDLTNAATAFAPVYANATPVAVDCGPETWCMDPDHAREQVSPQTEAIIPVHLYGHPVDMDPILDLADDHDLTVIEDAAEAHGAEYKGQRVGGIGEMGCFSFYANKIITTGEGGMIVTDDEELAERARLLRNLAFDPDRRFKHDHVGFNYRMSNVHAAIGVGQLDKLDEFVRRKREIATRYSSHFEDSEYIITPVEREWAKNVYWMYGIVLTEDAPISRDRLREELDDAGIETRTFFLPMSDQQAFTERGYFSGVETPHAHDLADRGLYLPSGVGLSENAIDEVTQAVKRIIK